MKQKRIIAYFLILILLLSCACTAKEQPASQEDNFFVYKQDGQMYFTDFESDKTVKLTDNLGNFGFDYDITTSSSDGKMILCPDNIEKNYEPVNLYLTNTQTEKKTLICEDAVFSFMSDDGRYIYYATEDESVYMYDSKKEKSELVGENVTGFYCFTDGKAIVFMSEDENGKGLYYKKPWKKAKLKDTEALAFDSLFRGEEKSVIYQTSSGLGVINKKGEILNIPDAERIVHTLESGNFYWIANSRKISLAELVEPDKYVLENSEKMEKLKNTLLTMGSELYFYNGEKSVKLTDNYQSSGLFHQENVDVFVFFESKSDFTQKVKLDNQTNINKFCQKLYQDYSYNNCQYYLAIGSTVSELIHDDINNVHIKEDLSELYYLADVQKGEMQSFPYYPGTLYCCQIKDEKVQAPTVYDTQVSKFNIYNMGEELCYIKNLSPPYDFGENKGGEFFAEKEKITDRVYEYEYNEEIGGYLVFTFSEDNKSVLNTYVDGKLTKISENATTHNIPKYFHKSDDGKLLFLTDENTEDLHSNIFGLNIHKNGSCSQIAKDVSEYKLLDNGSIVCINNNDGYTGKATLSIYKDGKLTKLADNVTRHYSYEILNNYRRYSRSIMSTNELNSWYAL